MVKESQWFGTGFVCILYHTYPYTGGIWEDSDLSWVRFMVKMLNFINCTYDMYKIIDIHTNLTYLYNTHTNTVIKIESQSADGTGSMGLYTVRFLL